MYERRENEWTKILIKRRCAIFQRQIPIIRRFNRIARIVDAGQWRNDAAYEGQPRRNEFTGRWNPWTREIFTTIFRSRVVEAAAAAGAKDLRSVSTGQGVATRRNTHCRRYGDRLALGASWVEYRRCDERSDDNGICHGFVRWYPIEGFIYDDGSAVLAMAGPILTRLHLFFSYNLIHIIFCSLTNFIIWK